MNRQDWVDWAEYCKKCDIMHMEDYGCPMCKQKKNYKSLADEYSSFCDAVEKKEFGVASNDET